jgi:hypothetical protein
MPRKIKPSLSLNCHCGPSPQRCLAAERKLCHDEFANRILGQGTTVKIEKLSDKSWQWGQ